MEEHGDGIGKVCIYQATDTDVIRRHVERAVLRGDEIIPVMDTVVKRADPQQSQPTIAGDRRHAKDRRHPTRTPGTGSGRND